VSQEYGANLYDFKTYGALTNFIINNSIIEQSSGVFPGSGNLNTNPQFIDTANANLYVQPTSPAIDAGNNISYSGNLNTDTALNGVLRLIGSNVDIGAYEYTSLLISQGVPGTCVSYSPVLIDNTNNNVWVPLTDTNGNIVAELKANGNNLGVVNYSLYVHNGQVREDGSGRLYLNRNITITPQTQPTTPVDIRLYLTNFEFEALKNAFNSQGQPSGVNTINDVGFLKNSNDICGAVIPGTATNISATGQAFANGYFIAASIPSFSSFFFSNSTFSSLPLTFVEFNVKPINNAVLLDWKTSNEVNTNKFIIERSENQTNFITIGTQMAAGNAVSHQYSFTDMNIASIKAPIIYYRLKQVDLDGKIVYSKTINVSLKTKNEPLFTLKQNPVNNHIDLSLNLPTQQNLDWIITDNNGRVLKNGNIKASAGNLNISIPVGSLVSGVYYLSLQGATFSQCTKFIKQ
ncbi:MAG: T9SS type A sorting domain-containing protein, partial [Nitrososphaeraceae archaeon]|nr:T9SS type A sorting domain-containing protein [Nitrososphaeraceae archaeon]